MTTENDLNFDLLYREWPFKIKGAPHVVREMNNQQRESYLNDVTGRVKLTETGSAKSVNFNGQAAALLTRSVFNVETGESVTADDVATWPASMIAVLSDKAKELSALDKDAVKKKEEDAKND